MYVGRFRTFLFPPLDLDFALHSQIIIFTIIALPLDVVYLMTIHSSSPYFQRPLHIGHDASQPVTDST